VVEKGESFGELSENKKIRQRVFFWRRIGRAGSIRGRKP
jgi:hypothetical protein